MCAMSVLIVEDHHFQREYLKSLFRAEGVHRIETASDGHEALQWLGRRNFDLVLSDLMMPGLDGVQFIQRLALSKSPPRLALMSSSSRRMLGGACTVAEMLGIEVIDTISKPAMSASIKNLVKKSAAPRPILENAPAPKRIFSGRQLVEALEQGQFKAWFQPKLALRNGRITSAEALARWEHPILGTLLPGQFLAQMVDAGLEEELLFCMVEQAVEAQASWQNTGFRIPVSINLPTHLLNDTTLPDRLHEYVLKLNGIPSRLCFELTECSMTELVHHYIAGVCRLRMKGFGLAQDDFGQGFSSFYNLVRAPFTELKIDRALIANCEHEESTAAALKSIIMLGQHLGLEVVAEGVENHDQLALLRRFECDVVQGFLISKAVSKESFEALLQQES